MVGIFFGYPSIHVLPSLCSNHPRHSDPALGYFFPPIPIPNHPVAAVAGILGSIFHLNESSHIDF